MALSAEELRIGNLCHYHVVDKLYDPPEYDIVNTIDYDDIRILYKYEDGGFKPIPLTEEWLLKFGFEGKISEVSNCGNFYLRYNAEYGRHGMAIWHQKGAWCFSHTNQFTMLRYVHQLQNLYFALTGEELQIKSEVTTHDIREIDRAEEERRGR
jgi:hypothetical protein